MDVVVVESPAKAKTINKYLGSGYTVIASYGHIRDLPPKDGSVDPGDGFAMQWEIDANGEKHIRAIADAVKKADRLILATDPDREGEAISWHVQDELTRRNLLKDKPVSRVVFNEITKRAILEAMENPRDVDQELVRAYLARRALDYLVGFTLSPVLWRKLPGSRSAGRVQSVALRLICEREKEVEDFRSEEYWTVDGAFLTPAGAPFSARLTHFNGEKLEKFSITGEIAAQAVEMALKRAHFSVDTVERKTAKRHPYPPFTTSTLQQEAARKLHFPAKKTMEVAQRLYEGIDLSGETVGLITYMRTDGVQMAMEAIDAARVAIARDFGQSYLPGAPRVYKTKAKNAQEAHEAIRPTNINRTPASIEHLLSREQFRLYDLIWKRTIASQMESAVLDQVAVDITAPEAKAILRATGSIIAFDGFLKVYREDTDDSEGKGDEGDRRLPPMESGQILALKDILPEQHFTQPPPRYSEASLVKKMEELGIGRPSTYASIISVLQDRSYVRLDARRFIPEDRGRVVTAFLENYFSRYVQYTFTADLEHQLDEISDGKLAWKTVLADFWQHFAAAVDATKDLRVSHVLDQLDADLGPHFFPEKADGSDPRACPQCGDGRLGLRLGKHGAFIGCSHYPECRYTRPLSLNGGNGDGPEIEGPRILGPDPVSGDVVSIRKGPYGTYAQLGEERTVEPPAPDPTKPPKKAPKKPPKPKVIKPKRVSLPRGLEPMDITLDQALALLALPRDLGGDPETGEIIQAGLGRFGPYVKRGTIYKSLAAHDDVLTVDLPRACELLAQSPAAKNPPKEMGPHPADGKPV
ncbi:MAG: type I DNA topoisomerase, partial [Rhodospirillaceae bacterium]|nr:type I DNA topoisomerase [Rhodospirillaceae bacterium]